MGAPRVEAVDAARGLALIGMMVTHVGPAWDLTTGDGPPIGDLLAGGRAAPLFCVLAGVSLALMRERDPRGSGSLLATVVRAAVLLLVGTLLASLPDVPVLVILPFYAVLLLAAIPFRDAPSGTLLALSALWAVAVPLLYLGLRLDVRPEFAGQPELSDLSTPLAWLGELTLFGAYPPIVWFAYVLLGLGVGKLDLRSDRTGAALVGVGAVLTAASLAIGWWALTSGRLDAVFTDVHWWQLVVSGRVVPLDGSLVWFVGAHSSTPLNVVGAMGTALVAIGLCVLLVQVPWGRLLTTPLRAVGSMTFTLYTVHVLLTWVAVEHDWTLGEAVGRGDYTEWWTQVLIFAVVATLWRRHVGRGPLEAVTHLVSTVGRPARVRA